MCQLTLIDFDDKRLAKFVVRPLTEINMLGINATSNHDGFGYVRFTALDEIVKSKLQVNTWWTEFNFDFRRKFRNVNGIYHVRACSSTNKNKTDDEHSHPFETENIILAHNGTLHFRHNSKDEKDLKSLMDDDVIDSENFLKVLDYYVQNDIVQPHLVADNIQEAVDQWSGSYAFLILDRRNPKSVFVVKDDDKKLHKAEFTIGKKTVGIIINTMPYELKYVGVLLCQYAEAFDMKLTFTIEELDDMNIWIYRRDTYKLNNPVMEIVKPKTATVVVYDSRSGGQQSFPRQSVAGRTVNPKVPYERAASFIFALHLSYIEVIMMTEVLFGQNFFTFDADMMNLYADFLEQLKDKHSYKGRIKAWNNAIGHNKRTDIYTKTKIQFPFFLNSQKFLKKESAKCPTPTVT